MKYDLIFVGQILRAMFRGITIVNFGRIHQLMKLSISNIPEVQPMIPSLIKLKSRDMKHINELISTASDLLRLYQPFKFPCVAITQVSQDIKTGIKLQNNFSVPPVIKTEESLQMQLIQLVNDSVETRHFF